MSAVIRVEHLTFGYGHDTPILDDVSLSVGEGERVALVGPNGSGKTTLLRLLMGLEQRRSGRIEILDEVRGSEEAFADARRAVGLMFQDSDDQLFCPTVHEDVAFGPFNLGMGHSEVHEVVRETLALLGIEHLEHKVTYRLSEGQKRLVALATILAMRPRILLLDEPTTGLDRAYEDRLAEVLIGLPLEMLIVSHNEGFIGKVATRTETLSST